MASSYRSKIKMEDTARIKVYLRRDGNVEEVRRILIEDISVLTNLLYIREKIIATFPVLQNAQFKLTWRDADGDEISVTSDDDLEEAFTEMGGRVKYLYVTPVERFDAGESSETEQSGMESSTVTVCDGCNCTIEGFRYKCMQCPDYDLCFKCEKNGQHPHHLLLRMKHTEYPSCLPKIMHILNKSLYKARRHGGPPYAKKCGKRMQMRSFPCAREGVNFMDVLGMAPAFLQAVHNTVIPSNTNQPATGAAATTTPVAPNLSASVNPTVASATIPNTASAPPSSAASSGFATPTTNGSTTPQPQVPQINGDQIAEVVSSTVKKFLEVMQNANGASAPPAQSTTPMEVENPRSETIYPNLEKERVPEPGWTFVQPETNSMEEKNPLSAANGEKQNIKEGLKQLLEMGFSDELNLVALLKRFHGNVGQVVKYLFENTM